MGDRPKRYSQKEFIQLLKNNGYECKRNGKGSHMIYAKFNDSIAINKELNHMVQRRLIKEHNLKEN